MRQACEGVPLALEHVHQEGIVVVAEIDSGQPKQVVPVLMGEAVSIVLGVAVHEVDARKAQRGTVGVSQPRLELRLDLFLTCDVIADRQPCEMECRQSDR